LGPSAWGLRGVERGRIDEEGGEGRGEVFGRLMLEEEG
jgi:hypothetical protein